LIIGIGVPVIADLADGMVHDGIAADLGRAAIQAAAITGDLIAVVAFLGRIDDTVAAGTMYADALIPRRHHAGSARHNRGLARRTRTQTDQSYHKSLNQKDEVDLSLLIGQHGYSPE
jgi:hypothetical protein